MISILIPFHNEEANLRPLVEAIKKSLPLTKFELVLINDGSTDSSYAIAKQLTQKKLGSVTIKLVSRALRQGKGRALTQGFKISTGTIIIFMDADLQDDPEDLTKFVKKIENGLDVVNGWRKHRLDGQDKTLPSKIANKLIWRALFGSSFHDMNCGFKAFRREVLEEIPLYGDNYRFLPYLAEQRGFEVGEVIVNHRPRTWGRSKYNAVRMLFGLIDSLSTYVIVRFSEKPLHFFAPIGGSIFILGFIIASRLSFEWLFFNLVLSTRPLFLVSIFLMIVGLQIIMTGILAEIVVYMNLKNNE